MRSTFSSIEHLQDLFNLKKQSKKSDLFYVILWIGIVWNSEQIEKKP